jgi:Ni,Fe-hydrogenase III large subunit
MTAVLCGNRFGRGLLAPGGLAWDIDAAIAETLTESLESALTDAEGAVQLLWETPSVLSRFEGTGVVSRETASAIGMTGPAARASGLEIDVRRDFPSGIYRLSLIPLSVWDTGDVFARALVRWLEIQKSAAFIREQLASLPHGPVKSDPGPLPRNRMAVSLVEGWRGEICHVLLSDENGSLRCARIVDPSFHNWFGLALALRGQQISDFPLCNKSFNLSYCGHDL